MASRSSRHDAAGGVGGEGQHQHLGPGGNGGAQLLGGEAELILRLQLHIHRGAAGHGGQGSVAHEGGHGHDDLVPGIEQAAQGQVDGLTAAHGDHDLVGKIVVQVEAAGQIGGDLPPQLGHTGVAGVLGEALLQGVDAGVPDVPGGNEIGLTDTQGDGVLHLLQNVKKAPDARGLHILDALTQYLVVVHEKIHSFGCFSCFSKIRCFSLYLCRMK